MHLRQQPHNPLAHRIQIRINHFQCPWRLIHIKMPVKGYLITDNTDLTVLLIALVGIDPGIRHMGCHFPVKVGFDQDAGADGRVEGNILVIPQIAIGLEFNDFVFVFKSTVHSG